MNGREIDIFNGDADGLCAAHQLRLAEPGPNPAAVEVVTGLKRDIALVGQVREGAGARLRVFDLSLDRNRVALERLLAQGASVRWFDHHFSGPLPSHPALQAHIDPTPTVCTSVIVDRLLAGRFRRWAVVAAYGDNLAATARELGAAARIAEAELAVLRELGEAMNYNSYGETEADVLIQPAALYALLRAFDDPLVFAQRERVVTELAARRRADLATAVQMPLWRDAPGGAVYLLPDAPWSRRVHGAFANLLAERASQCAFAVAKRRSDSSFAISVRAPIDAPRGADRLCRAFGGGGREAAAGIDALDELRLEQFTQAFAQHDWGI